ncbi:hypothetical protein C8R43DRAFT_183653 [Mycena crocata]|nr:hypothetical protein C8R43DRAFT_183653 [Mycena crocata]
MYVRRNSYVSNSSSHASYASNASSTTKKKWWALGTGGTKGWTSDTGWGCMLRTGQSLLATALQRVGEPPLTPTSAPPFPPPSQAAHAVHARLVSWFLDTPVAPFGVHRMALAGKAAGKDVGMWFGPSAAAGALRMLVDAFPVCGLGVSVATDGTLYQTEVYAASHSPAALATLHVHSRASSGHGSSRGHGARSPGAASYSSHSTSASGHSHATSSSHGKHSKPETKAWGDRPVLLLLGIRLGLDGVNPVYHDTIKMLYTFPQSVGIAGGRPSSSYYFVGVQGNGLFYLDPHHSRPAVPLRPYMGEAAPLHPHDGHHAPDDRRSLSPEAYARGGSMSPEFARGGSMSPELVYPRGGSMSPDYVHGQGNTTMTEDELVFIPSRSRSASADPATDIANNNSSAPPAGGHLTPAEEAHFARAYSTADLRTFHCERVRKMALSGLDPSMLIGFVVRDEAEWVDLRRRVSELPRTIFAIQDEPPTWPGDDEMGLESISDPEEEEDTTFDDGDVSSASHAPSSSASHGVSSASHGVSNASHVPASTFSHTHAHSNSTNSTSTTSTRSEEVDTEEDPVAPITPLPNSRFDLSGEPTPAGAYADLEGDDGFVDAGGDIEIEDDWVDPVPPPPAPAPSKKGHSSSGKSKTKGKKKAVPVPSVHYPFPVSVEDAPGASSPPQLERERQRERERNVTVSPRAGGGGGQRMHTARARDGGRTQSGGVRGILTED